LDYLLKLDELVIKAAKYPNCRVKHVEPGTRIADICRGEGVGKGLDV